VGILFRGIQTSQISKKKSSKKNIIIFLIIFLTLVLPTVNGQIGLRSGWEIVDTDFDEDIFTIISTEDDQIWGFGESGLIITSNDGGNSWEKKESITENDLTSSDYLDGTILVSGTNGTVLHKVQDGAWDIINIPDETLDIKGAALSSTDSYFVIGHNGIIWHYDSLRWNNISFADNQNYNSISFIDGDGLNGIIVGEDEILLTTLDGGINWEKIDLPTITDKNLVSLQLLSDSRAYATTENGHILVSRGLDTSIGFDWDVVNNESFIGISDGLINNVEVVNSLKIIISGQNNIIATSKDGGNTFEFHNLSLLPLDQDFILNDLVMIDGFCGVASGSNGVILKTVLDENGYCSEGLDQTIGFEIEDFNRFGDFIDKYSGWMLEGLIATMKIVIFGIIIGFLIGIVLAMCKTAPTSLKDMIESNLEKMLLLTWLVIPSSIISSKISNNSSTGILVFFSTSLILFTVNLVKNKKSDNSGEKEGFIGLIVPKKHRMLFIRLLGISLLIGQPIGEYNIRGSGFLILESIILLSELSLNGIDNIFAPVGNPGAFLNLLLGIMITVPGLMLITFSGNYNAIEIPYRNESTIKFEPWKLRPLNTIATIYTDIFRNTPLIVQFLFLHFGIEIGKRIEESAGEFFVNIPFLIDIFSDRIYLSAICALAFNSGAYQCETLRGAIAAIPSGQMEAGRSIGLTYLQTMRLIIIPQAIRICIPPLGNEIVNLVLNSSLAMVIGYTELTRQGKLINAITFQITWTWGMVMISYFIVTWTLALILRRIEVKTRIPGLGIL
jgi:polar amino acid transport system permease protein